MTCGSLILEMTLTPNLLTSLPPSDFGASLVEALRVRRGGLRRVFS